MYDECFSFRKAGELLTNFFEENNMSATCRVCNGNKYFSCNCNRGKSWLGGICEKCNGTGRVPCATCGGTGRSNYVARARPRKRTARF